MFCEVPAGDADVFGAGVPFCTIEQGPDASGGASSFAAHPPSVTTTPVSMATALTSDDVCIAWTLVHSKPSHTGVTSVSQHLVDPLHLCGQLAGVAGTNVGLEHQAHARRCRSDRVDGLLHHRHDLVPLPFDVGEHGVGLVRESGRANPPDGLGDGGAHAAALVAARGADAEG